jgi:uncharacterized protein YjbI with pentapeptide repeats
MADVEHIIQLKKGRDKWNKWRNEPFNREIIPNLRGADIHGVDLSGVNLSGSMLRRANLSGSNLSQANLNGVDLSEVNLSGANLSSADMRGVNLSGSNLRRADLSRTNLTQANLNGVDLIEVNLSGANLSGADIRGVNLSGVNLSGANFSGANLSGANFSGANLTGIRLIGANLCLAGFFEVNLSGISLKGVNLSGAKLNKANLSGADLAGANLNLANLNGANLSGAKLSGADLSEASLVGSNLSQTDLSEVNFSRTNLNGAKLSKANIAGANLNEASLSGANIDGANLHKANLTGANLKSTSLKVVQALGTNFTEAILTGACIQDWHIHSATNLDKVSCEYIYLKDMGQERRPSDPNRMFAPGEFSKLFQKALETVDLIFADRIDWSAFYQSFQELKQQYFESNVSIQAIECKNDGAFVIRLQVDSGVDKAEIERVAIERYRVALKLVQTKYSERLKAKDEQIVIYQKESAKMEGIVNVLASRTMANINDFRGANFGGGAAIGEGATQIGGSYNDFSQTINNNLQEIQQLITALRSQAVCFSPEKREETEVHIGDLEEDLRQPEKRDPKRIKARLLALLAIAGMIGGTVATATDFTNNVLELGKKFGIELVQP